MIHFSPEERSKLRELLVLLAEDCPSPVDRTARKGERDRPARGKRQPDSADIPVQPLVVQPLRVAGPACQSATPDPDVVRQLIRQRAKCRQMFGNDLVANPVWDMLLDLLAAYCEGRQISVTSLCIAAAVPQTTALSWINRMLAAGMIVRTEDQIDRRRVFIRLNRATLDHLIKFLDLPARDSSDSAAKTGITIPGRDFGQDRSAA